MSWNACSPDAGGLRSGAGVRAGRVAGKYCDRGGDACVPVADEFPRPCDSDQQRRDQGVADPLHGRAAARVGDEGDAAGKLGAEDQQKQDDQVELLPLLAQRRPAGPDGPYPRGGEQDADNPSTTAGIPTLVPGTSPKSETASALENAIMAAAARTC